MTDTRSGALAFLAQQGALLKRNLRKPISIDSRRIALERMITLEFPHVGAFFAEYSSNLSMTGMFIRTDRIQRPGTLAAFEFNLADGMQLISGEAEVVWVRKRHEGPDRPAGLGLRFVKLSDEGRQLIRWAVEKRLRDGGESFDLDKASAASTEVDREQVAAPPIGEADPPIPAETELSSRPEDGVASLHPESGAQAVRPEVRRWRWPIYAGMAGLLFGALFFLYRGSASETVADGVEPSSMSPVPVAEPRGAAQPRVAKPLALAEPGASAASKDVEPVENRPVAHPEVPGMDQDPREIVETVAAWADAWSSQRVDAYLAFYADSYRPSGGMSLASWSALRRDRITGPRRIEVGVTDLEVEFQGADAARVRFLQSYVSDRYRDSTRKVLDLVREDGHWKIQDEQSQG